MIIKLRYRPGNNKKDYILFFNPENEFFTMWIKNKNGDIWLRKSDDDFLKDMNGDLNELLKELEMFEVIDAKDLKIPRAYKYPEDKYK